MADFKAGSSEIPAAVAAHRDRADLVTCADAALARDPLMSGLAGIAAIYDRA